jgi:hypothetical protein
LGRSGDARRFHIDGDRPRPSMCGALCLRGLEGRTYAEQWAGVNSERGAPQGVAHDGMVRIEWQEGGVWGRIV